MENTPNITNFAKLLKRQMINIKFPDGSSREYNEGTTPLEIAQSISPRLAQDVLAVKLDGNDYDLTRPVEKDASIQFFKWEDEEGKHAFWHSSAHLLAEALQELFPGVKFGIGPAIENGFYYDIDPGDNKITDEDFKRIEDKMLELARRKENIVRREVSKADALEAFGNRGETYKCELISELEDGTITTYTQGNFTDLCRGPHLPTTAPIKAAKVMSLAGAYWRGDEKRQQLVRVYGITFPKKKMLDEYLALLEEAKKRDHRKLGREMELFHFSPTVGQGQRRRSARPSGTVPAQDSETIRLSAGNNSAYRQQAALRNVGPLGKIRQGLLPAHPHSGRGRGIHAQTHELPPSLRDLQGGSAQTCLCVWPSSAPFTATNRAASSTDSLVYADLRKTTLISSVPPSRLRMSS